MLATQGGRCELFCVDSGRNVTVAMGQLRELEETVQKIPALARACKLAGVEAPPSGEWKEASRECLDDLADCEEYQARVILRDRMNRLVLFLYREGDKEVSINEMMLAEGWARMERDADTRLAAYPAILRSMRQFQQEAKEDRVGIYVHGDIGFETDDSCVCFQNSAAFSLGLEETSKSAGSV